MAHSRGQRSACAGAPGDGHGTCVTRSTGRRAVSGFSLVENRVPLDSVVMIARPKLVPGLVTHPATVAVSRVIVYAVSAVPGFTVPIALVPREGGAAPAAVQFVPAVRTFQVAVASSHAWSTGYSVHGPPASKSVQITSSAPVTTLVVEMVLRSNRNSAVRWMSPSASAEI